MPPIGGVKKNGGATYSGNRPPSAGMRNLRSVWSTGTAGRFKGDHPAIMNSEVIRPCVLAGCPEDGVVLDPFNGSGSTGAVACAYGRDYIGLELNPEFVKLTQNRLSEFKVNLK